MKNESKGRPFARQFVLGSPTLPGVAQQNFCAGQRARWHAVSCGRHHRNRCMASRLIRQRCLLRHGAFVESKVRSWCAVGIVCATYACRWARHHHSTIKPKSACKATSDCNWAQSYIVCGMLLDSVHLPRAPQLRGIRCKQCFSARL